MLEPENETHQAIKQATEKEPNKNPQHNSEHNSCPNAPFMTIDRLCSKHCPQSGKYKIEEFKERITLAPAFQFNEHGRTDPAQTYKPLPQRPVGPSSLRALYLPQGSDPTPRHKS